MAIRRLNLRYCLLLGSLVVFSAAHQASSGEPSTDVEPPKAITAGPLKFTEAQLLHNYAYAYGVAAVDLNGDGLLDLTSADAEPNCNLYLLLNQGEGKFRQSYIQKFAEDDEQAQRMERHAIGDVNGDGLPDVVMIDNLLWDIRWFEHPGNDAVAQPWKIHRLSAPKEVPGSYDVALADFDDDGDLDVAASSWRFGNRFDWFENAGEPGNGSKWTRHEIDADLGETRTIDVGDFNRDGKPDLLGTARIGNLVVWYENSGDPVNGWKKHVIDAETINPTHGHPVDMDGDGDLDVVMTYGLASVVGNNSPDSHQVAWYENIDGLGEKWKKHVIAPSFPQGFEAVAGDLDKDGDLDIVATGWSSSGSIAWFENNGDPRGKWKMHVIKPLWPMANTVVIADLDNDGRLDIVASAEHGANEIRWWRNDGPSEK